MYQHSEAQNLYTKNRIAFFRGSMKYIVITGGVLSGLGKGITASSIGRLLKSRGFKVTAIKIDPYLNCDAGTMNPFQHGEVFVLEDGGEVDLDLGNYERFLDTNLTSAHNITTGKAYKTVIEKERRGEYLGETVQIIPHITNEIRSEIKNVANKSGADLVIIEVGGTVGDIESMPFLEAVRQLHIEVGHENLLFIHTTLIPVMGVVGEQKTKPTQHSVKQLREIGIQPDIIVGRGSKLLEESTKQKISLFCDVPVNAVVSAPDAGCIYEIPLMLERQGVTDYILKKFGTPPIQQDLDEWKTFVHKINNPRKEVDIAIVGKYTNLKDSYISHLEAFKHVSAALEVKVNIIWVEADDIEKGIIDGLEKAQGIIIPGGFGVRGSEGKIFAARHARENNKPFLGICLGFQLAVIEYCRNVIGLENANSSELKNTEHPVVDLLPEQKLIKDMGATMRLGTHPIIIDENTKVETFYNATEIYERHRHRYEINPNYIDMIEKNGLRFSGKSLDGKRMEIAELKDHPFYIASQFHPEFKSRPGKPSILHLELVKACSDM